MPSEEIGFLSFDFTLEIKTRTKKKAELAHFSLYLIG